MFKNKKSRSAVANVLKRWKKMRNNAPPPTQLIEVTIAPISLLIEATYNNDKENLMILNNSQPKLPLSNNNMMCSVRTCGMGGKEKIQKFPDPNKTPFLFNEWVKLTGNQKLFNELTVEEIAANEGICSLHFELKNNNSIVNNIGSINGFIRRDIPVYPTFQLPEPLNEDKLLVTASICYSCCVPNCPTKQIDEIFCNSFPEHPGLYRLWISNINRPDLYKISQKSVLSSCRLCNLHFEEYQKNHRTFAIPTVLLPPESYEERDQFLEGIQEKEHHPRLVLEPDAENFSCCVSTCVYENLFKHRFPEPNNNDEKYIEQLFNLWIMLIGDKTLRELSKKEIYENYRICSGHFLNSDYDSNGELKSNSYPCLTLPNPLPPIKPTKIKFIRKLNEISVIKTIIEHNPSSSLTVFNIGVSNNIPGTSIDDDRSKVIVLKHEDFYNKNFNVNSAKDFTGVTRNAKTYGTLGSPRLISTANISSTLTISKKPAVTTEMVQPTKEPNAPIKYAPKRKGELLPNLIRTKQLCFRADIQ